MRMGVDTGGTFTDFVMLIDGQLYIAKRLSTPHNPSEALLAEVAERATPDILIHGTTVATNALLERRGARTALITTRGFADVLAIGRGDRPSLYNRDQTRPEVVVPRELRLEVNERTTFDQQVLVPLADADVLALIPQLEAAQVESIAICLLHAYANPAHETRIGELLHQHNPNWQISISHQIVTEAREYERTATSVVNAYVAPIMARYLDYLATHLPAHTKLRIMASDGGSMGVRTAQQLPARTTLSGPAGGIVGAFAVAQQIDIDRIISFDMGGTSTDVALCDGTLPRSSGSAVGGMPVRLPSLDIHTVGAGGGSLARIDSGGALRVGPESAGANPGPACYGKGTQATVTDANVILGRLRAEAFLGGNMTLDVVRAEAAIEQIADTIHTDIITAALGIVRVVNAAMARAVRTISVERGYNPRDFALVAFGGAGPLHAVQLAEELGMEQVIIPLYPGVLSALGMVTAQVTRSTTRPLLRTLDQLDVVTMNKLLIETRAEISTALAQDGEDTNQFGDTVTLAMRYRGQAFDLDVPLAVNHTMITREHLARVEQRFHQLHQQRYGHAMPHRTVEVTTLHHTMANIAIQLPLPSGHTRTTPLQPTQIVMAYPDNHAHAVNTALYARDALQSGDVIEGPAIITQLDATSVIPSGWQGVVTPALSVIVSKKPS